MSDSRASPLLPPDGQSEQVSIEEARNGRAEPKTQDNSDRETIRRESPDGSENPGEEPTSGANNHTTENNADSTVDSNNNNNNNNNEEQAENVANDSNVTGDDHPQNVTGDDQPQNVTCDDQPQNVTGDGQPQNVTGDGQPQNVTGDGQPQNVTGHDQPQNGTGDDQDNSGVIDTKGDTAEDNVKQETDDNNNISEGEVDNPETDAAPEDGAREDDDNQDESQQENKKDEADDIESPRGDATDNKNEDKGSEKPGEDNSGETQAEKDASDTVPPSKTGETTTTAPATSQSQRVMRKIMTTPADDSGLTQPMLPAIPRGQAKVQQLATSISDARNQVVPQMVIHPVRSRVPPKLMRLATVTVSPAKSRPMGKSPSMYYEEPKRPQKVITWDQAHNARPPLRMDMEGPGPCTYSPLNKPLNESNSPSYTFGTKCCSEKPGLGARTSWSKSWFQSNHLYHQKADYIREGLWPSPNHYPKPGTLGLRQRTMYAAPSYTFGHRHALSITKPGADKEPSPNDYERQIADKHVLPRGPSFSHQFRREGTVLWGRPETTPGPAAYVPLHSARIQKPAYTIQGIRREKSHMLGPYSTM